MYKWINESNIFLRNNTGKYIFLSIDFILFYI